MGRLDVGETGDDDLLGGSGNDTLNGDENKAQDAKTMLDACNALMQEFNCSVILVHHTGLVSTPRWRWNMAIKAEVEP
mgnify:CR=1 FL=1